MLLSQKISSCIRRLGLMPLANYIINIRYFVISRLFGFLGYNYFSKIYNDTFYDNKNQEEVLGKTPELIAEYIVSNFHPASVVDFGCGTGIYLQAFFRRGIEVQGIDASPSAKKNFKLSKDRIMISDITRLLDLAQKYSCAICFEVAEHIPKGLSENLVLNLCHSSDLIIFSAAPKGQGGIGHINERPADFWINSFERHGFNHLKKETAEFKKYLNDNQAIFWLKNNILIFKKQN
jgi:2-polyprenyl-3-methyl-5-hydroxy-6-metoxy-1,4-benzoquinol methylase